MPPTEGMLYDWLYFPKFWDKGSLNALTLLEMRHVPPRAMQLYLKSCGTNCVRGFSYHHFRYIVIR
jgi:hypothetical protein